ncbi:YceD family protein [Xanthobacter variabilis]|uniref:YceD family protein n=1 Tax=Xanthobacter variabilis TaxID=3119932 RepID=UPI003729E721
MTEQPMTEPPMTDLPFRRPLSVADVPPQGLDLRLEPNDRERAALARHLGVIAVPAFVAQLHIAPEGAEGLHVTGSLNASVVQDCGVTLEPFEAPVKEILDVHFVPAGTARPPETEEDESYDPPDEIDNGSIDLGALVAEFLALGVDPYPRKPGAVFEAPAEDPAAASPFSALARLKGKDEA